MPIKKEKKIKGDDGMNKGAVSVQNNNQATKPSVPLARAFPKVGLGDSGTRMLHGIITEEYLPNLQGLQGIKVFDEMRKSDGTVRAAMLVTSLPIRRAQWFVNPAIENDAQAEEIANFVEHALFDWLDIAWEDFIRQALLMLPFGVMPFEKVYTTKDHEGKTYVTLEKLAPRLPKSIYKWELSDGTFGIQQLRQDGVLAEIPGSKLVIFVNEREGDNWWGTSMIRGAYKHWYYKNGFYKIDALAFERQGLGVPVMKMPQGYTESDESKATNALQNLRASEMAYLLLPSGYEFEFANMGGTTTRDPQNSINHHNKEILQSVLAQFLELGATRSGGGSRALSQDHSDLFLKAMESIANTLISVINKELIPELVDMNFNNVTVYPVLDYEGISKVDIAALGTAYNQIVTAGGIKPSDGDDQYLRTLLGLPARTQDDIDAEENDDPSSEELLDHADIEDNGDTTEVDTGAQKADPKKPTPADNKKVDTNAKSAKTKASSHVHKFKKRFDDGTGFMSWRPLTFAEQKVNFKTIEDTMNEMQDAFSKDAKTVLQDAKDTFLSKVQKALDSGDTRSIASLEVSFITAYKTLLKDVMQKAYEYGKKGASAEMNILTPASSAQSLAHMEVLADTIANKTASDIESKAKLSVVNGLKQETSTLQALGKVDATLDDVIDKSVDMAASVIIGQGINNGRNDVFARNTGMIHSLQRSEILDEKTCNFCLSVDGLVVEPSDPFAKTDIYHSNCRGIWVEILTDEVNPPDITGVPNSLQDLYGGEPNALIQPNKPIIRPGAPAEAIVKQKNESK